MPKKNRTRPDGHRDAFYSLSYLKLYFFCYVLKRTKINLLDYILMILKLFQ